MPKWLELNGAADIIEIGLCGVMQKNGVKSHGAR